MGNLSVVSPEIYAKARSRVALKAPEIFVNERGQELFALPCYLLQQLQINFS